MSDEKTAAERVNQFLGNRFGHGRLRLQAVETEEAACKFEIQRDGSRAYNLSEGECSLVAFCYFIATLEDISAQGKELIIFIDDPISSLDSNHVFFVYSLIESEIASPLKDSSGNLIKANNENQYCYHQLFLSTHNLEFLKYLKRLSGAQSKSRCEQYMIVAESSGSVVRQMPPYLRQYMTEFNYLFAEICKCAVEGNAVAEPHCFYNFGNNLRKFLEAFLYFKYPFAMQSENDHRTRVAEFFQESGSDSVLVQRLTNELSHLGKFDRGEEPVDHAEVSRMAKFVLEKMKCSDERQYECLLSSVDQADPLVVPNQPQVPGVVNV